MLSFRAPNVDPSRTDEIDSGNEEDPPYRPVDADPDPQDQEDEERRGRKKIVRYYDGVNPEVEAELKKVIEELEQKGIEKVDVVQ